MSASVRVRADAARALAAVLDGRSLKAVLAGIEPGIADPRDRALLHAIVYAAVRGTLRWRAALAMLIERPLPAKARPVEAALITALAQLADLGMSAHAVVDDTVAAVRTLGQPRHAGLVNAVLRRWLRECATIEARLDQDEQACHRLPSWWLQRLRSDWPGHWPAIVAAGNAAAPMWLRVNTQRIGVDDYLGQLAAEGLDGSAAPGLPQAVRLGQPVPVARLPGFADGLVSVQDGAAQHAAGLLGVAPGQRVLDACAAPGGKAAHLLEAQPALSGLVALDSDPDRLALVGDGLARLGLSARLCHGDAGAPESWWDRQPFDRILLDAPCSASGILRRQPDVRLHRRPSDIATLAAQQERLLSALWPLLASGGRMLYAVCSVFRAESEDVVGRFLQRHDDAVAMPLALPAAEPLAGGEQLLPGCRDMDGFAYALLARR